MELRFYNINYGMDWFSRHQVVLDCLRARVHISGAEQILVACTPHAEELLDIGA